MRSTFATIAAAAVLALCSQAPARAASLQVEPILVDVTAPGAASTVTLHNTGTTPINAQVRVFRWTMINGEEKLEPTNDVVASPPSVTLAPDGKYVTRVVRVSKQPVVGEESYRLLVDQLPDLAQQKNGSVNLMIRYSIPVFFGAPNKKNPTVTWSLAVKGDKVTVMAHNSGDRRLRIAGLTLHDQHGKSIKLGDGLNGYALGQSTKSWTIPAHGFAANGSASISAQSDGGPVQAVASIGR